MLASKNPSRIISRKNPAYICSECKSALTALRGSQPENGFISFHRQSRLFRTLQSQKASIQAPSLSSTNVDPTVRDHLRAWAIQNQRRKQYEAYNAGNDSRKLIRLAALPNSLFLDDSTTTLTDEEDGGYESWEGEDFPGQQAEYCPGDLAWWYPAAQTKFARSQLAIFIGRVAEQSQWMLADGRWVVEVSRKQKSVHVPGFATQTEVEQIQRFLPVKPLESPAEGLSVLQPYSFAGDVPSRLAQPLMARLAQFSEAMSTWQRENMPLLDSLYDRTAEDERYKTISFSALVGTILGIDERQITPEAAMVVFRTVEKKFSGIITRRSEPTPEPMLVVSPKRVAQGSAKVRAWARDYQEAAAESAMGKDVTGSLDSNPLSAFVAKARRLIVKSRALRSPTTLGCLGPSSTQEPIVDDKVTTRENDEVFGENDRIIIEFLWDNYVRHPPPKANRNAAIAALILRAIGAYPKLRLDVNMGRLLLQELGILPPWTQSSHHDVSFDARGQRDPELERLIDESNTLCNKSCIAIDQPPWKLGDSMHDLRQEFTLPVYCIDASQGKIREDGHSIEPNPERAGSYWIHSHLSHPSAFVDPEHVFAQRAQGLLQNLWLDGSRIQRLFPQNFTLSLSLRPGAPAFTVSTLLTEEGEVLDIKMRPTILRNVVNLDTKAVADGLGAYSAETASLAVGASVHEQARSSKTGEMLNSSREAVEPCLPDLRLMQRLLHARVVQRRKNAAVVPDWYVGVHHLHDDAAVVAGGVYDGLDFRSKQYLGDPHIQYTVNRYTTVVRLTESYKYEYFVALLAELLSESAATWFSDRQIPGIFTGSRYNPGYGVEVLNKLPYGTYIRRPSSYFSSTPQPYVSKCFESLLWVNNPLRRFQDNLAAWNAGTYLRAEAAGLVEPGKASDKLHYPFTAAKCDELIQGKLHIAKWQNRVQNSASKVKWGLLALFRAFHFKEAELPEIWDCFVHSTRPDKTRPDDSRLRGALAPFQFPAVILSTKEGHETRTPVLSFLPVKLELVDLENNCVVVRPVGPHQDDYTQRGPMDIGPKREALHSK
jgi:hypothetical protein